MATIRFEGVSRRFTASTSSLRPADMGRNFDDENGASGAVAALDNVHLTIPNGQTMAIVGPSGCGKSTLLRVAAGLDGEYTGNLYFDDRPMQDVPAKDRHIGMVFQNYALYPHFEGQGNLSFFFRVRKIADAEAEERIRIT
ncbi:MAG: ABC transporter ATP-binding protein, partial [Caldilineaceae bacterium]|nr:ABC transporter ATP-binding protein [Caldilineaceae bacterium]